MLATPTRTRKKAVIWTGEHGFLNVSWMWLLFNNTFSLHIATEVNQYIKQLFWSFSKFTNVLSIQSHWKETDKYSTPLLQRQCCPTLNFVTGISHYLSGQATCWKIWREHTGSPLTKCTSQVSAFNSSAESRESTRTESTIWYWTWWKTVYRRIVCMHDFKVNNLVCNIWYLKFYFLRFGAS